MKKLLKMHELQNSGWDLQMARNRKILILKYYFSNKIKIKELYDPLYFNNNFNLLKLLNKIVLKQLANGL